MDWKCIRAIRRNKNLLVIWYLVCQYLSNVKGERILSLRLCEVIRCRLIWHWDEITDKKIKLLSKEDVTARIIFSTSELDYPGVIVAASNLYLREWNERRFM